MKNLSLTPLLIRELMIKSIRNFFYEQHFHEVIPTMLQPAIPLEPTINFFKVNNDNAKTYYLPASPESDIKKLLACGLGNCFAISKSFRNLEDIGPYHLPEFLMLEWYRKNATYTQIMQDTKELMLKIYSDLTLNIDKNWQTFSLIDLWKKHAGLDLTKLINDAQMYQAAKTKGYQTNNASWEQLYHQIFLNEIEPKLVKTPCFLIDFPSRISPLCAIQKNNPNFSQRFELYLNGIEIGNGNTENTDIKEIKQTFKNEQKIVMSKGIESPGIDQDFLIALKKMQKTSYAGMGIGIDRLAMILSGVKNISAVDPLYQKFKT